MGDEDDVEVLDQRRSARLSDAQRTGHAMRLGDIGGPTHTVPCRQCGRSVEVSAWVMEIARQFDGYLEGKGERPIEDGELTMCPPCGDIWQERKHMVAMRLATNVGEIMRQVKDEGRDLRDDQLDWLRKNGYSDSADGAEAIMRRRKEAADKDKGSGRRKGDQ